MKKIILFLFLFTTLNSNAVVIVSGGKRVVSVDNSLQNSLTKKDYHFTCKKCKRDFVISDMLYHENTDMYFYYKQENSIKILQPYDKDMCDECTDKYFLKAIGIILIIVLCVVGVGIYECNKD